MKPPRPAASGRKTSGSCELDSDLLTAPEVASRFSSSSALTVFSVDRGLVALGVDQVAAVQVKQRVEADHVALVLGAGEADLVRLARRLEGVGSWETSCPRSAGPSAPGTSGTTSAARWSSAESRRACPSRSPSPAGARAHRRMPGPSSGPGELLHPAGLGELGRPGPRRSRGCPCPSRARRAAGRTARAGRRRRSAAGCRRSCTSRSRRVAVGEDLVEADAAGAAVEIDRRGAAAT